MKFRLNEQEKIKQVEAGKKIMKFGGYCIVFAFCLLFFLFFLVIVLRLL